MYSSFPFVTRKPPKGQLSSDVKTLHERDFTVRDRKQNQHDTELEERRRRRKEKWRWGGRELLRLSGSSSWPGTDDTVGTWSRSLCTDVAQTFILQHIHFLSRYPSSLSLPKCVGECTCFLRSETIFAWNYISRIFTKLRSSLGNTVTVFSLSLFFFISLSLFLSLSPFPCLSLSLTALYTFTISRFEVHDKQKGCYEIGLEHHQNASTGLGHTATGLGHHLQV